MDTNKKEAIEALEDCYGIVSIACKRIGLARSTFYNWKENDEEFKKAVEEIQEVALDHVESKLFEKINGVTVATNKEDEEGNPITYEQPPSDTAIIFYLKTRGKERGYVERQEFTGANGERLSGFNYVYPNEGNHTDHKSNGKAAPSLAKTNGQGH